MQEAYLDSLEMTELDEGEFEAVAGGGHSPYGLHAKGPGGCKSNYYKEQCGVTWETGSCCDCTDFNGDRDHTIV